MEERQRFSVLRNTDLHEAMHETVEEMMGGSSAYKETYSKIICDFMDKVAGRTCSEVEKDVFVRFATGDRCIMAMNIRSEEYLRFPESPSSASTSTLAKWVVCHRRWKETKSGGDLSRG